MEHRLPCYPHRPCRNAVIAALAVMCHDEPTAMPNGSSTLIEERLIMADSQQSNTIFAYWHPEQFVTVDGHLTAKGSLTDVQGETVPVHGLTYATEADYDPTTDILIVTLVWDDDEGAHQQLLERYTLNAYS